MEKSSIHQDTIISPDEYFHLEIYNDFETDLESITGFKNIFFDRNLFPIEEYRYENFHVNILDKIDVIQDAVLKFSEKFKKEIEIFQIKFGKENVKVCFGLLQSYQ